MPEYKVGDLVFVVKSFIMDFLPFKEGEVLKIVDINESGMHHSTCYATEGLKDYAGKHTCNGTAMDKRGWFVRVPLLEERTVRWSGASFSDFEL